MTWQRYEPDEIDYVAIASKRGHFLNEYIEFDAGTFGIDRGFVKNLFMSVGSGLSSLRNEIPLLEKLYYGLREPVYEHRRKTIKKVLQEEFEHTLSDRIYRAPFCACVLGILLEWIR